MRQSVVLQLRCCHGPVLLLELTAALSLLALNPLPFLQRKHLFILHTQLPALKLKVVQHLNHRRSLFRRGEVCKGQTSENAIVKMIVECVRKRQVHVRHQLHQLFLLHGKGDVLDHDRRRDQFILAILLGVGRIARMRTGVLAGVLPGRLSGG